MKKKTINFFNISNLLYTQLIPYLKIFILIFILIISCTVKKSDSTANQDNKNIESEENKTELDTETVKDETEDITISNLVSLFFEKQIITPRNTPPQNTPVKNLINSEDIRVIIDWQEENTRYIKIFVRTTGKYYTIKEGDTNGEIILLERKLTYYSFKIKNQIVKVNR